MMRTMRRLLSRALRLPLRLVPKTAVLPVLSGELRGSQWIAGAATHGSWLGSYERLTQRIFREQIRAGSVIYDVGANAGFFTLLASKLAGPTGRVYAFEPLPRNLTFLREHVRLNKAGNVDVLELAVSHRDGAVARFASAGNPAMGGLSAAGDLEVRTCTLDSLISSGTIAPPDFIKMDIEGAEYDALTGARQLLDGARAVILLAMHGYRQYELCAGLLQSTGYSTDSLADGEVDGNYVILATPAAR